MSLTTLILILGAASMAMRVVPGLVMRNVKMPAEVYRAMAYVPITIFTALIVSDVFFWDSQFALNPVVNIKLIPTVCAMAAAYYTKDLLRTIFVGIGVLTALYVVL